MKKIFFLLIIAYQALFYTNLLQASCSQSNDPNVFRIHGTEETKAVIEGDCLNELLTAMGEGKNIDIWNAEIKGGIDFTNPDFFPARSFDEVEKDLSEDERSHYNRIKELFRRERKIVLVKGDIIITQSIIDGDITTSRKDITTSREEIPVVVSIFKKGVNFGFTQFAKGASFWYAQFAKGASFWYAQFAGWAYFWYAQFAGEAHFGNAQFAEKAYFGSAQFAEGAYFGFAQFAGEASFSSAQFAKVASFVSAQFAGEASFSSAQFAKGADFRYAQFAGWADFGYAQFAKGAYFVSAKFDKEADFGSAQFAGWAEFGSANLSRANLHDADLGDKASLRGANLDSVIFEPKPGTLPLIRDIAQAENLFKMQYKDSPESLVELRKAFKNAGYRRQEREITYAIEHTRRQHEWDEKVVLMNVWNPSVEDSTEEKEQKRASNVVLRKVWSVIKLIVFELTSDYGMSPHRPILYMFVLFLICLIPYMIALNTKGENGIWLILDKERVLKDDGQVELVRLCHKKCRLRGFFRALQFSLLSAFHVGWRDINPGYWIARMQRQEYTLRATGWVRMVSGVQSLISVYLMALSILTYFGRPFE